VYSLRNSNFLLTIQKLAQTRDQIKVVDDQIGSPTWAKAIAVGTTQVLKQWVDTTKSVRIPSSGTFHLSCEGETSWFEFAKNILELSGLSEKVELLPIPTTQYHTSAARPQYSLLSNEKIKNIYQCKMPRWLDALKDCLKSSQ
jgi:dTDP-4-dehydrorhamnose reductase